MSFDPNGEWGLRHRLRVAIRQGYSYDSLAVAVHVPAAVLLEYLTNPAYELSSEYVTAIVDHIFDVEAPDVWYDRQVTSGGTVITYVESAYWTEEQLESVMVPDRAQAFKVHYLSESEQHRPMSTPLYTLPENSVVDVAIGATGDNLERLVCIVFYEYADIEA